MIARMNCFDLDFQTFQLRNLFAPHCSDPLGSATSSGVPVVAAAAGSSLDDRVLELVAASIRASPTKKRPSDPPSDMPDSRE